MVGVLVGAQETKVRQVVVIASAMYLAERPDVLVGILTTKSLRRRAQQTTSSWTGDPQDSAQNPASARTC